MIKFKFMTLRFLGGWRLASGKQAEKACSQAKGKRKVRICYFVHGIGVGGASLSLLYQIQQLDREIYQPVVVFLYRSRMCDVFRKHGIKTLVAKGLTEFSHTTGEYVHFGNPRGWLKAANYLPSVIGTYRLLKRLRPDIVHLNSSTLTPQLVGAKLAGVPAVWHIREHIVKGHFGLRRWLHKVLARYVADAVIFILKSEAEKFGCPNNTHVVYNFVDFDEYDRYKRDPEQLTRPGGSRTVVMLGGVAKIKGTLEYVQAYSLVKQRIGQVRFLVVGDAGNKLPGTWRGKFRKGLHRSGGYSHAVHSWASAHGQDGIVFTGVVENIPALLARVDLVVFPSTVPHFARPVIEAGAMALPVVASDLEGPREIVVHGDTGLLVPPGDVKALAEAIIAVLSDDALAKKMGERGYRRARQLFDARENTSMIEGIYREVLSRRLGSSRTQMNGDDKVQLQRGPAWLWRIIILAWLSTVSLAYYISMLTLPGRVERIESLTRSILHNFLR